MRVFLAHSSAQRRECDIIATKLRARGFRVFYSPDTIEPSEDFDRSIRAEIARCQAMIFLLSPESVTPPCYALTELQMASERWPNPRRRVLGVLTAAVDLASVPNYLRYTVELLNPRGDLATETADVMVKIRRAQRKVFWVKLGAVATSVVTILAILLWRTRLAAQARLDAVEHALLEDAKTAAVYYDTCTSKLGKFAEYKHGFVSPERACDARPVASSLSAPALVVGQTGYGKRGFMQTTRGAMALKGRTSVIVSHRDCTRGGSRDDAIDLSKCLIDEVERVTKVPRADVATWLSDRSRYVLFFDAIDDSASRERVHQLIQALWDHQQRGGSVVLSSQPENLKYVLARYGLLQWMGWVQNDLPTFDVRGVNVHGVQRVATAYEEHRVPIDDMQAVLDFPQRCPQARAVIEEWISQPKLFREHGSKTVAPVAAEIRKLGQDACVAWKGPLVTALLRARVWSYCHDELCDFRVDGPRFIAAAQELGADPALDEAKLKATAEDHGFGGVDQLAFPLLSTGMLFYDGVRLRADPAWIPD